MVVVLEIFMTWNYHPVDDVWGFYRPHSFSEDTFSEDTMNAGETLMAAISEDRRKSWQDLIESVDMTHNSKRAWSTIKKINNDPKKATLHSNVTADQVAHQLLLNGKPPHKTRHRRVKRQCGDTESTWQFSDEELDAAIDCWRTAKPLAWMTSALNKSNIFDRLLESGSSRCSTAV